MFTSIRTKIRECEWYRASDKRLKFNALVTTYEIVLKDATHLRVNKHRESETDRANCLKEVI